MLTNVVQIKKITEIAADKGADIVVYPEYGLLASPYTSIYEFISVNIPI